MISMRFEMPGLSAARTTSLPTSVPALFQDVDRSLLRSGGRRHSHVGSLQVLDPRGDGWDPSDRHDERLPEASVEPLGDVAGQLEVLPLVLTHRHLVGLIREDVRRLQDGVEKQPGRHERPVLLRLLLELRHP
jgi:hypothetical protein